MNIAFARTKVTQPTRPWLASYRSTAVALIHAPSFYTDAPRELFALCDPARRVGVARPDLSLCPECVSILRHHHLWPL